MEGGTGMQTMGNNAERCSCRRGNKDMDDHKDTTFFLPIIVIIGGGGGGEEKED
jgi:hypothetical protein